MYLLGLASFTGAMGVGFIGVSYAASGVGRVLFMVLGFALLLVSGRCAVMAHCEHRGWPYPWNRLKAVRNWRAQREEQQYIERVKRNGIEPKIHDGNWICPYCDKPNKLDYDWCNQCTARRGGLTGTLGGNVWPPPLWPEMPGLDDD